MAVNGQIWATPGTSKVDLYCQIAGSPVHYVLDTAVYVGDPGSTPLWIVSWPGYCVAVDYWTFGGGGWSISAATIGVAGSTGQIWCPTGVGSIFSGRAGTVGELAVIGGYLSVCIATGTTNNWQAIHV